VSASRASPIVRDKQQVVTDEHVYPTLAEQSEGSSGFCARHAWRQW
jgi:hypothetical protein